MSIHHPGPLAVGTAVVVIGLGFASLLLNGPPTPRPADASADTFSAARAMRHVGQIARRPHPLASVEHDRVRDYIVAELGRLGLAAERQPAIAIRASNRAIGGRIENVMARLAGTEHTRAVLLATHYDSGPVSPGAADDGSGVATLLESLRALTAGPPLRHDVIALFTDGEENGLLGADAFAKAHPWAKDAAVALNFEARGTRGPSLMFETGPDNGVVVRAWAGTAPRPAGSSLSQEIYQRLPNDTDFSVFRAIGIGGLNFAFIGNWKAYHSPLDSVANLDPGSLQQHGDAALAMTRYFGQIDLETVRGPDEVYFSLPYPHVVVRYPETWALPLAGLAAVFWLIAAWIARGRKQASIGGIVLGVAVCAVFSAAAVFAGLRAARALEWLHSRWLPPGNVLVSGSYALALVLAIVTAWCALYVLLRRWFAPRTMMLSASLAGAVVAVLSARNLAGGSYVFLWPLLAGLAAVLAFTAEGADPVSRTGRAFVLWALSLPAALILWPLAEMLFSAVGMSAMGGAALAVVTVFGLAVLAPHLELVADGRRWWPAGLALAAAAAVFAFGAVTTRDSAATPRAESVVYAVDADARDAMWVARTDRSDAWISQYLGAAAKPGRPGWLVPPWAAAGSAAGYRHARAPLVETAAPSAALIESVASSDGRRLTLRVVPASDGHALSAWIAGPRVLQALVGGRDAGAALPDQRWWSLDFANAPIAGLELTLQLHGADPVLLTLVDTAIGLPAIPGASFAPRPPWMMPAMRGDQTLVRRAFTF